MYLLVPFVLLVVITNAASSERKASFTLGNSSVPLNPRGLFERQYTTCDSGYGLCDAGQCCPADGSCCASRCANADQACCGDQGYVYPLDGSECCSDGSNCPPGSRCYECADYPGEVCCYDPAAVASYSAYVGQVSAAVSSYNAENSAKWDSYTQAVESINAENSAKYSSYTAALAQNSAAWASYTAAVGQNSAARSSYEAALSSYSAGGGAYQYQHYYTTYWYYVIYWYTITIATPELTSSSSSTSTVLSAYCSNSAEAQMSFTFLAQSVDAQVSSSAVASSAAAFSTFPSAMASYSDSVGGTAGDNGAGSMAAARSSILNVALPALGLASGILAILL